MNTNRGHQHFSSRGLTIEPIMSYSKWRIVFNGLIDIKKPNCETNENVYTEPQHVNFTFL